MARGEKEGGRSGGKERPQEPREEKKGESAVRCWAWRVDQKWVDVYSSVRSRRIPLQSLWERVKK